MPSGEPCIEADAVSFDYETLLDDDYFTTDIIAYIDPQKNTTRASKNCHTTNIDSRLSLLNTIRLVPDQIMEDQENFKSLGYCIAGECSFEGNDFEDGG